MKQVESDRLERIEHKLDDFIEANHLVMFGDAKVNGDRGLIGNVRDLKEYMTKYPSVRWYLAHKPREFWTTVAGIFALSASIFIKESREFWTEIFRKWLGL